MSVGQYTHVTKAAGTVLTAPIYNNAHVNHRTNDVPTSCGAHSDTLTQYRTTTDPAPAGVPTIVASEALELEQLRFVVADIKKRLNANVAPAQWYTPVTPTAASVTAHGARINRTTTQNIPNTGTTLVSFNNVQYDTGVPTPFWAGGNPTRLTAPVSGIFQLTAFGQWSGSSTTGTLRVFFLRNGGSDVAAMLEVGIDNVVDDQRAAVSTQVHCTAGDYFELAVSQTASVSEPFTGADFAMELLNPDVAIP